MSTCSADPGSWAAHVQTVSATFSVLRMLSCLQLTNVSQDRECSHCIDRHSKPGDLPAGLSDCKQHSPGTVSHKRNMLKSVPRPNIAEVSILHKCCAGMFPSAMGPYLETHSLGSS